MIKSFRCKETEKLFYRIFSRRFSFAAARLARRKLLILDAATELATLQIPPSNHLDKLRGKRQGQYSIRINSQWRICFVWKNGDAYEVEIVDYH